MNVQKILNFFYSITRLDICMLDSDGKTVAKVSSFSFPEPMQTNLEQSLAALIQSIDSLHPKEYCQGNLPLFYLNYLLVNIDDNLRAIIGPYLYKDVPSDAIQQLMRSFSIHSSLYPEYLDIFRRIPTNFRPLPLTADLLFTLLQNDIINGQFIGSEKIEQPVYRYSKPFSKAQALRNTDYQYAIEDRIRAGIRNGNTKEALRALSANNNRFEYRSTGYTLWHAQHMVSVMGTVMRIAAREGGVSPQTVHSISEKYYYQTFLCKSESELENLLPKMIKEYSQAVQLAKLKDYSPIVQAALSYLHLQYSDSVTINEIADYIPCHPNYLCQCFKKETGVTIMQKLTDIRLDYALALLSNPSFPITQIASEVGYSSYAHFSSVFRKKYGCNCSEWRKTNCS